MSVSNIPSQVPAPGRRSPASPTIVETPAPGDVLELRVHLVNLWRGRTTLALLAVLLGLAGAAVSLVARRQYEATATVSVSPSIVAEPTVPTLDALGFVTLVTNQNVAEQTVREFKLNEAPYNLSPQALLQEVVTVRAVPASNLVRVVVRLDEPELAARVANGFSDFAIDHAGKAKRSEVGAVEDDLKTMLDEATDWLKTAETAYNDYRRTAQIELVKKEVETLLAQRAELLELNVTLDAERARLAKAETELSSRAPITTPQAECRRGSNCDRGSAGFRRVWSGSARARDESSGKQPRVPGA